MRSIALAAVLLLLPAAALAGGYAVPNVSPRDLSMCGSLHAAQEDAGAAFVNPAALSRLDGISLSLAASFIDFASTWSDPTGTQTPSSASTITRLAFPPAVYAGYGGRHSNGELGWGVGIGLTVPFGGNVYWPDGWPGRFDIETVNRRIYGTFFSAGIQMNKWVRLGGALIWYRGTEELSQKVNFITSENTASLSASGNKLSYDLSLELQPLEPLRIGIDYKHKADMSLTGDATFGGAPPQFVAQTLDQGVTHDLTMPNYFAVGASWQFSPALLVTGAFSWERARVYDKDAFIGDQGTAIIVQRNYHNGYTFRAGVEAQAMPGLKVRAGILRDIAPTPAEWLSATIPDSDVWAASVGLGYTIMKGLDVNVAYFHAFFDKVTTPAAGPGGTYNVFPGTYETHANIASLGVSWAPTWGSSRMD